VSFREHNWVEFFSPRNGRLSIQACSKCGVAKSAITEKIRCAPVSPEKRDSRLRGWTRAKSNVELAYKLNS